MSRGFSPLERRLVLAMVSLMRDRQESGEQPGDTYFEHVSIKLADVYEHCYVLRPDQSWDLQRRNQRQAMRRALGRLHDQGFVWATALAWVTVAEQEFIEWQGGGKETSDGIFSKKTPNWKTVTLSGEGCTLAVLLEKESHVGGRQ